MFLKDFIEEVNCEKKSADYNNSMKIFPACKELSQVVAVSWYSYYYWYLHNESIILLTLLRSKNKDIDDFQKNILGPGHSKV